MCEAEKKLGRQPDLPRERGQSNGHISGEPVLVCACLFVVSVVCVKGDVYERRMPKRRMRGAAERREKRGFV